jgi:hypothetical protein
VFGVEEEVERLDLFQAIVAAAVVAEVGSLWGSST